MQAPLKRFLVTGVLAAMMAVAACGGGGGQSAAQATSQITGTWESFFSGRGGPTLVQGMNPQLQAAYAKTLAGVKGTSAIVESVQLLKPAACTTAGVTHPCATVTYNVAIQGAVALKNSKGYAVRVHGQWLVAKVTLCGLLALEGGGRPPAGC